MNLAARTPRVDAFDQDPAQSEVLEHRRGPLLVTGPAGSGKSAVLRERFARLVEHGADPERIGLVVRTRQARAAARRAILERLQRPLPGLRVVTVQGLAHYTLSRRFQAVGYEQPPDVLTAVDQFARVRDLLAGEDPGDWPAYGVMLGLRGFADQVRQFLLRSQEALLHPDDVERWADGRGAEGWRELGRFYRRYLDVLNDTGAVDFAGLVVQAAAASSPPDRAGLGGASETLFDHLLVDDYHEATFSEESLIVRLAPDDLVVAGDAGSHVFSFQGTTDVPLRQFSDRLPTARTVVLPTQHRAPDRVDVRAWFTPHTSDEHAAIARELRRLHVEEGVPWPEMAVVARRQASDVGGLLRALDDAGIPRVTPEAGLSLLVEPATRHYVLALRWLARREHRDALIEPMLTSELARLSPAAARGLLRAAKAAGEPGWAALAHEEGLDGPAREELRTLRSVLSDAEGVAGRSVLDAFSVLWRHLPCSARLVQEAERSAGGARDLAAILAFAESVARAEEGSERSVGTFLDLVEAGREGPGVGASDVEERSDAVRVLTAHGTAGLEFDVVVVAGAVEGNFPSLTRPEPMFDLEMPRGLVGQAERNRVRLADERRLFGLVMSRARKAVLITASDPHGEETLLTARSRFVSERGVTWQPAPQGPFDEPVSSAEAAASWRRALADHTASVPARLASLDGLVALGVAPERWWFQRDWTGTARPLHETIRASYSKLSTLENCELQYVLAHELGLDDRAGYQAWVGHTVHRLIEDCEKGLIERSLEALTAAALERWRPQEFPSMAVSESFKRLVVDAMLPAWFEAFGRWPALATEIRFAFDLDGASVTGYIDRIGSVEGGGSQITDYKTGKKSPEAARPKENLQLGIYYLAVNRADELAAYRPVRGVELAFLKQKPTRWDPAPDGPYASAYLPITPKSRDEYEDAVTVRLTALIGQVRRLMKSETYRPNPAADCYFCGFKTLCPIFPEGAELFAEPRVAP
jgi:superfamily I DNA/RNA helicase/RecB family exonuclease